MINVKHMMAIGIAAMLIIGGILLGTVPRRVPDNTADGYPCGSPWQPADAITAGSQQACDQQLGSWDIAAWVVAGWGVALLFGLAFMWLARSKPQPVTVSMPQRLDPEVRRQKAVKLYGKGLLTDEELDGILAEIDKDRESSQP